MQIKEYKDFNIDEIKNLYDAVGWKVYTDNMDNLMRGYENSLKVLAAFDGDKLIGIIRAVGDGFTIVFIQDILVIPSEQRKGIGKALVKAMINLYPKVRQIELATDIDTKTISFYKSLDFREFSELGCCGFMRLL
ncbi:MAG: GNAT family N-acetyltransferase [Anaerococcus prevotii]|uniref:GNAT family N-acetyltransferase n=1 Tax=Anaerococcus prevotii TaxID=33034 RepID=UPI002902A159|nr:GNAT family N-acetyltransferase [Anaerococcus prevotii]MDU2558531.1 GNAT family N-acetyltransferase [Anaerococcus prevotii]